LGITVPILGVCLITIGNEYHISDSLYKELPQSQILIPSR
jgi:hypothetical protein